ncbi:DUF485 domain-containing protein [Corticibacter populi]|uniref:DUF485 domain-containing protein n=1 Tax=Corticibacter populi TaxID=1550736 RepID=A0A3M6QQC9_9BURK|nr:DUF485 domain-containing protein [Corticibacter populi]RMX05011.1 DUF485 domain-containing protein [Corticibacter populi]RZS33557.1 uncharacterized membrane protein (DUF485 family) [Corticibacter populi]
MSTSSDVVAKVVNHPRYQELLKRRGRISMAFFVVTWVIYAGYILTLAYNPALMARPVGAMTMTVGVFGAVLVCLSAVILIAAYVYISNKVFDPLLAAVLKDVQ